MGDLGPIYLSWGNCRYTVREKGGCALLKLLHIMESAFLLSGRMILVGVTDPPNLYDLGCADCRVHNVSYAFFTSGRCLFRYPSLTVDPTGEIANRIIVVEQHAMTGCSGCACLGLQVY